MLREIVEKLGKQEISEAKKAPELIQALEAWLKVVYPGMKVSHDAKWNRFKGMKIKPKKETSGMSNFQFESGIVMQDALTKMSEAKRFSAIAAKVAVGINDFQVLWQEA